ncbi:hypothetical protein SAMN05421825_0436 [Epilithonimonas hungarica]|uniref:Uncharacterized protein n=1 Tax=Epilithonimonas hungarica TaxID=454006 RepID=A0A1G7GE53_9FLAO|nr:hypothetical protein SAMN05421825_0436 [Epilithonimonas hungarica]
MVFLLHGIFRFYGHVSKLVMEMIFNNKLLKIRQDND